jgi:cytochrome c6
LKRIIGILIVAVAIVVTGFATPALAGDSAKGKLVFTGNCAACHMGGKNTLNPQKTLSKEDLEKFGKYGVEEIIAQVTNGAGAMPSFKTRLQPTQIEDVATYVFETATAGW